MNNIERIRQELSRQKYGAMLITDAANRLFATGFRSSDGALLVTEDKVFFYTDSRYFEAAEAAITDANVLQVTADTPYSALIAAALDECGIASLGFEDGTTTYAKYLEWQNKLGCQLIPIEKTLSSMRAVKSADDLAHMKKAQRIAEKSFEEILPLVNSGISEKELAAELLFRFLKNGAADKAFDTIVVSGPKSSMPHGIPENVRIGKGFLTIDFGVRLDDWCSDTTRTVCIGQPDEEMVRVYDTVLKAQEAGIKAVRAGKPASEVDAGARAVIENDGYGEYFGHGFGHGLGLEVHEEPRVSKSSECILPAGAVISAEPGIYLPGRFGVRVEDVVYVKEDGCENITKLPKKLLIL